MISVGLTGSIASGKSTISAIFEQAGAKIIDADQIAKDVVQKGLPAWHKIVAHFGHSVLLSNGQLNRAHLAEVIFNDPIQKNHLNAIVHPYVHNKIIELRHHYENLQADGIVILDVPLLYEVGMEKDFDKVIVVYVPEVIQLERLMQRDGICEQAARSRIKAQLSMEEKKRRADILIDNSGTLETTQDAVLKIYQILVDESPFFN